MGKLTDIHFEVSERKVFLRLMDWIVVFGSLWIVYVSTNFDYLDFNEPNWWYFIVLGLYLHLFGQIFEMYNLQVSSSEIAVGKSVILTATSTVFFYLLTPWYSPILPANRIQILYFFLTILISLLVWRYAYARYLATNRFYKKVLLFCNGDAIDELEAGIKQAYPYYRVVAYVDTASTINAHKTHTIPRVDLQDATRFCEEEKINEVSVGVYDPQEVTHEVSARLLDLLEHGFSVREYAQVYESLTFRIPLQFLSQDFYRYFPFSRSNQNHLYLWVVRLSELLFAVVGLLIACLILPFVLLGNAMGNRGPLFYSQERVGQNGVPFRIYKLRSMVVNAEKNGAVFAQANDVRITPFGKFLRKSRLDEVPQLFNILRGDMSFIGPRPERPVFVEKIASVMPYYKTRHAIKPGLTGWAQVNYSYGDSIEDSLMKLQYDLFYIKHRSIFLDLNIMVKTLSTVLFYRGQ